MVNILVRLVPSWGWRALTSLTSVTCFCSHGNVAHGMETIFLYIHAEMTISRTPWAPEGSDFTGNID